MSPYKTIKRKLNRRQFLFVSGGATLFAALRTSNTLALVCPTLNIDFSRIDIGYVVTDEKLSESLSFGSRVLEQGGERLDVANGLTNLWQKTLKPHWQQRNTTCVTGLTSRSVLDCLAEQARSQSHRAKILGLHHSQKAGFEPLVSWIIE